MGVLFAHKVYMRRQPRLGTLLHVDKPSPFDLNVCDLAMGPFQGDIFYNLCRGWCL
jgi:hypothetical protein